MTCLHGFVVCGFFDDCTDHRCSILLPPHADETYTCGCGIYVHPTRINLNALHIEDCPWYVPPSSC